MPIISPERLVALQHNSQDIRNICILAHVDHGKTSLTDALIATNGIISPKLAGKIRYLDSRPDEQLRGITMESSAISLCFSMTRRSEPEAVPEQKDYLINLIDSPGHVDFSSEVSTASRLCDGAVVLVDAVEGVCSQTVTVLRQTWIEHLKPILVVNKIDRLVTELKMSAGEAYIHLSKLLEQVNAVLGSFFQGERMEEDLQWREKMEDRITTAAAKDQARARRDSSSVTDTPNMDSMSEPAPSTDEDFEERNDEDLYFAPENNNVIFSSAVDGWAFTVRQFAHLYEKKLGIKRAVLERVLWGDFFLDPKTKRVLSSKHLKGRSLKPMFVQLVLDTIWAVYEATSVEKVKNDTTMLEKITKSLSIKIPPHVLRSKDPRALMTTVFAAWLPLSTALLVSAIEQLPSPPTAQADRLPLLISNSPGAGCVSPEVRESMVQFKTSKQDPVVAYVSKMVSVPVSELPHNKRKAGSTMTAEEARDLARKKRAEIAKAQAAADGPPDRVDEIAGALNEASLNGTPHEPETNEPAEEPEQLVGFARLYSGSLSVGDSVYVLPPKFSPMNPRATPEPAKVTVTALYILMGRSLESLKSVPAGVVFGIGGLEGYALKSCTLCSQLEGSVNLAGISMGGEPIVRVALEPVNPADLHKMIRGLKLLEQSDACAQYEVLESGEHVILGAGELHLERCLKDLRERFARCDIQAGEPIVPYRESMVSATEMSAPNNKDLPRGTVIGVTSSKQVTVRLRMRPLPAAITEFLEKHTNDIRRLYAEKKAQESTGINSEQHSDEPVELEESKHEGLITTDTLSLPEFKQALKEAIVENDDQVDFWTNAIGKTTAFGPRRTGPNLLIDATRENICQRFLQETRNEDSTYTENGPASELNPTDFSDRISYAFQLAMSQGPLCNEPVQGIAVFLEEVNILSPSSSSTERLSRDSLGRLTGEVIRTVRESIRQGFLDWSPRLFLAMYSCEIQASTEVLGRVYAVITRRRGRIISEAVKEGTPFFTITALLPVAESFGFSDEIRKRTSGQAAPQLRFQGFEMLDQDPLWVPFTEDELEDLGELADKENVAKRYMDVVRRRKGLVVRGGKKVEGEKGRTLKK